jgi:hypothetical protein
VTARLIECTFILAGILSVLGIITLRYKRCIGISTPILR